MLCVLCDLCDEFDLIFPPLFLDIALDGKILADRDGFMEERLKKIRKIMKDSSLYRIKDGGEFLWQWNSPKKPGWKLDWGGLVEVTG